MWLWYVRWKDSHDHHILLVPSVIPCNFKRYQNHPIFSQLLFDHSLRFHLTSFLWSSLLVSEQKWSWVRIAKALLRLESLFLRYSECFAVLYCFSIGASLDCNVYTRQDRKFTSAKALFCLTFRPKFGAQGDSCSPPEFLCYLALSWILTNVFLLGYKILISHITNNNFANICSLIMFSHYDHVWSCPA